MGKGSTRNRPCWCNSGLKYKACHLNREQEPAPTFQDKLKNTRKVFGKKYCLHPNAGEECKGDIIKAHTVQRSGGLTKIVDTEKVRGGLKGSAKSGCVVLRWHVKSPCSMNEPAKRGD